ncbi:MAG: glucose-6-phosphate isomerase [Herminiimonas sp.]|nr:glucose-6-phosphate isomerase [Herminiimonas sp.]
MPAIMHRPALTTTAAYQTLKHHYDVAKNWQLRSLFASNPQRFFELSAEAAGLLLDYSKNRLDGATMALLFALARECGVEPRRDAMFAGEKINVTEQRPALHTALRAPRSTVLEVDGEDVVKDVHAVLDRMEIFTERIRSGQWTGFSGKAITDVVNIGIGGSYLGPKMACQALRAFSHPRLTMHFVSNVDGHDLDALLQKVDPATTLFIIASKTFTTLETMMNAQSARKWFLSRSTAANLPRHFVAISTNTEGVKAFGIDPENMFPFWDWVGGRYSIWSAIGVSVALAIGFEHFRQFLAGAHAMDQHFRTAPLEQNMPVILALVGVWYRNFFNSTSISIAPYHQDLLHFPGYLQQLEMESNGKQVAIDGTPLPVASCPVIWGDVGTNGQHAYFQLLHQGTDLIPVDFIAAVKPNHSLEGHHAALLANCFAQSEAFMRGKTADEVRADLQAEGMTQSDIDALVPHKTFPGNRPSNTILMKALMPATLGALIALYEHKVLVQGTLWNVNSFDQWGVELGKVLAKTIQSELTGAPHPELHDSSTNGLIARVKAAM